MWHWASLLLFSRRRQRWRSFVKGWIYTRTKIILLFFQKFWSYHLCVVVVLVYVAFLFSHLNFFFSRWMKSSRRRRLLFKAKGKAIKHKYPFQKVCSSFIFIFEIPVSKLNVYSTIFVLLFSMVRFYRDVSSVYLIFSSHPCLLFFPCLIFKILIMFFGFIFF